MIKKTITQVILKADEGNYLTNGEAYGKTVILPEGSDETVWKEISKEEYEEAQTSLEKNGVEANV